MRFLYTAGASALLIGAFAITGAAAQDDETAATPPVVDEDADGIADVRARLHRMGGRGGGLLSEARADLTDEQKAELRELRSSLRTDGANREDVHAAMQSKLAEFGVDVPDLETLQAAREAAREAVKAQREEIHALVQQLRDEGKTPEEVRAALTEAGYDRVAKSGRSDSGKRGRGMRRGGRASAPAEAE